MTLILTLTLTLSSGRAGYSVASALCPGLWAEGDSDLDGIVGDFEPQLRLEERTRRLGLVDVAEDLGG